MKKILSVIAVACGLFIAGYAQDQDIEIRPVRNRDLQSQAGAHDGKYSMYLPVYLARASRVAGDKDDICNEFRDRLEVAVQRRNVFRTAAPTSLSRLLAANRLGGDALSYVMRRFNLRSVVDGETQDRLLGLEQPDRIGLTTLTISIGENRRSGQGSVFGAKVGVGESYLPVKVSATSIQMDMKGRSIGTPADAMVTTKITLGKTFRLNVSRTVLEIFGQKVRVSGKIIDYQERNRPDPKSEYDVLFGNLAEQLAAQLEP